MTYYDRTEWGAGDRNGRSRLDVEEVQGIALHWPGDDIPRSGLAQVGKALRSWQAAHQAKGWADIAYQEAIDQAGNVYRLRGFLFRSAANGDEDVNDRFGAMLLVLAIGEKPTGAMIRAARGRIAKFRDHYPKGRQIVPHSAIRPAGTQCPGDRVRDLIQEGRFRP